MRILKKEESLVNLGNRLRAIREAADISQEQVNYATGITQSHISKIESGSLNVGLTHIAILADFFGLEEFELLQYKSPIPDADVLKRNVSRYLKTKKIDPSVFLKIGLTYILRTKVVPSRFLVTPRYVKEIVTYLDEKLNGEFTTTAVSQAMQSLRKKGLVEQIKTDKKSKFQYKSK